MYSIEQPCDYCTWPVDGACIYPGLDSCLYRPPALRQCDHPKRAPRTLFRHKHSLDFEALMHYIRHGCTPRSLGPHLRGRNFHGRQGDRGLPWGRRYDMWIGHCQDRRERWWKRHTLPSDQAY